MNMQEKTNVDLTHTDDLWDRVEWSDIEILRINIFY